jgi:hypothetical protein
MTRPERDADFLFYSSVDDELFEELSQLQGEEVAHIGVWEDSLGDALPGEGGKGTPANTGAFDIDLYLADGVYFELYGVAVYDDPDADPYQDTEVLESRVRRLLTNGCTLGEIAVDEEDALVLVLFQGRKPALYLAVGGWVLEEWDELPV